MKRIIGAALAAMLAVFMTGCGSTDGATKGDARKTAVYNQNEELNRPHWIGAQFSTGMNKNNYYWGGAVDEKGWFTSGEAKYADIKASTSAADLDGKSQIATHVKQDIVTTAKEVAANEGADGETQKDLDNFVGSVASVKISGIMRVDRWISSDGTVYVLMFVPESEIKKATPSDSPFAKKVMEKYLGKLDKESESAPVSE
ncbi:MAG: hypothetical protein IJ207_04295 [Treponema sp.]|uniref:hypothetical protein n=1 Tax=Treponema sp. TaxID=166 RepID=UPI0025F07B1F|nr:hypothetical protein [Treponema sp.]MBQ9281402.1 hypothetical protein [Treponema sp.]